MGLSIDEISIKFDAKNKDKINILRYSNVRFSFYSRCSRLFIEIVFLWCERILLFVSKLYEIIYITYLCYFIGH